MKKILTLVIVLALAVPLSLLADPDVWNGPDMGRPGQGMGMGPGNGACMMPGGGGPGMQCDWGGRGPGHRAPMGKGMRGGGMGMRGMGSGMGVQMLLWNAEEIGLTDDQVARLTQMRTDHQMERVDRDAALEKARIKMRNLMMDENASESSVLAGIDEVSRLEADLKKMRYSHFSAVRNVLTADQKTKLKELRQDRMQQWRDRWDDDDNDRPVPGRGRGMGRNN